MNMGRLVSLIGSFFILVGAIGLALWLLGLLGIHIWSFGSMPGLIVVIVIGVFLTWLSRKM